MRLLVTGASGMLGTYLVPELLADGHQVTALVHRTLPKADTVATVPGDVTKRWLGTSLSGIDAIVHTAGLVSFKSRDRDKLFQVNLTGTQHVAEIAELLKIPLFHISTAYVCGDYKGVFPTDRASLGQRHRNAYEQSKYAAEGALACFPKLRYTVIRPSVLVGDSQVKGIPPLMGMYAGLRGLYLGKRWLERTLALPPLEPAFRLRADPTATLNLIPVDVAARQIADLVSQRAHGTYHLVNQDPPRVSEVMAAAGRALGARIELVTDLDPNPAERIVEKLLEDLLPYLQGEPGFDTSNLAGLCSVRCSGLPPGFIEATCQRFLFSYKNSRAPEG